MKLDKCGLVGLKGSECCPCVCVGRGGGDEAEQGCPLTVWSGLSPLIILIEYPISRKRNGKMVEPRL